MTPPSDVPAAGECGYPPSRGGREGSRSAGVRPVVLAAASARRHVLPDGASVVVLDHVRTGDRVVLGEAEFRALGLADGVLDLPGIHRRLAAELGAAAPDRGVLDRAFRRLADRGMVRDAGSAGPAPPPAPAPAAAPQGPEPVDLAPGLRFACDGTGTCCAMYDEVAVELHEAGALLSVVPPGWRRPAAHLLTPARPGAPEAGHHPAAWKGRCAFARDDGRCAVHAALGPAAKPSACRLYPLHAVRAAGRLRVSLRPECACVPRSATGGTALADLLTPEVLGALAPPSGESAPGTVHVAPGLDEPLERWLEWTDDWIAEIASGSDPVAVMGGAAAALGWPVAAPPFAERGQLGAMSALLEGERRRLRGQVPPGAPQHLAAAWGHDLLERLLDGEPLGPAPPPGLEAGREAERQAAIASLFALEPLLGLHAAAGLAHLATLFWLARRGTDRLPPERRDPRLEAISTWMVLDRTLGLRDAQEFEAMTW